MRLQLFVMRGLQVLEKVLGARSVPTVDMDISEEVTAHDVDMEMEMKTQRQKAQEREYEDDDVRALLRLSFPFVCSLC